MQRTMRLTFLFCYSLFMICEPATSIRPVSQNVFMTRGVEKAVKQIDRRDTHIMLMDNISEVEVPPAYKMPMVMYRRKAKGRFRSPTPTYYNPLPANNAIVKEETKKTFKKYSGNRIRPKYMLPLAETYVYFPQKNMKHGRSQISIPHKSQKHFSRLSKQKQQEPSAFGKSQRKYPNQKPPTDSYDPVIIPYIETSVDSNNIHNTDRIKTVNYEDYSEYYDDGSTSIMLSSSNQARRHKKEAYSYNKQVFAQPVAIEGDSYNQQIDGSYSDVHINNDPSSIDSLFRKKQKKGHNIASHKLAVNTPWKITTSNEVLVGGQYAEPPARVVSRFQASAPMFLEDSNTLNPYGGVGFFNHEHSPISPYINYKNSNLAFSPQNLNDAFSIVD